MWTHLESISKKFCGHICKAFLRNSWRAHHKLASSTASYKRQVDLCCCDAEFEVKDQVVVHVLFEHLPTSEYGKLWSIQDSQQNNAYVLDLSNNMGISNIFKIEDLALYRGHVDASCNVAAAHLPLAANICNEIEAIVNTNIVSIKVMKTKGT
uniref:Uncharacterized protein n=1 Tax=Davidia involucrata TaxID=16924 RepID=A0A5B7BSN7_DAVIN